MQLRKKKLSEEKAKIVNKHIIQSLMLLFIEKVKIKSTRRDFKLAKVPMPNHTQH